MDGEKAAGDVVRTQKEAFVFQIDQLPEPVLHHLFKFLDWNEQKHMRQLCKGMERYILGDYGIHASVAARHSDLPLSFQLNPKSKCTSLKPIPDAMITQVIQSLEGKVIRTLEMKEMHPDFNPLPFQKLIQYPWKLMRASLRYVDVGFLLQLLTSCRNLSEFCYEGGFHRALAKGIQPVPIPAEGGEFIHFVTKLPHPNFQVDKLSSLSLVFGEINQLHSNWANVVFLLLALSQRTLGSLTKFQFEFCSFEDRLNLKDHLQILACIGQFLASCPNLRKLGHSLCWKRSGVQPFYLGWEADQFETRRGPSLPKGVLTCLIKKYGSALLKEMHVAGSLGFNDRMLQAIRQIMEKAGAAMKKLHTVYISWRRRYEPELFQILISSLPSPSIRMIGIYDQTGQSFTGGSYDLLLRQIQTQSIQPLYWNRNLELLFVSRKEETIDNVIAEEDGNEPFSLPRMLSQMPSLADIRLIPRKPHTDADKLPGLETHEPDYRLYEYRNDSQIPDVTFEEIGDVHFQALRVLRLGGVKILTEDAAQLVKLRNLEELALTVLPEYRHELFGIKSEDLLRLMGNLRKLEGIVVTMILFPEDEALKSAQVEVLQGLGHLTQMRRGVTRYNPRTNRFTVVDTKLMIQYKFDLGQFLA